MPRSSIWAASRPRHESRAAALAVLDHLWENREQRIPRLIVIDEAHNICPQEPDGTFQHLATERAISIAAEGRKYGLYLLLSTQRPTKVHPTSSPSATTSC